MKCKRCEYINVNHANYCYKCGNEFTKKEQASSQEKSIWHKLVKLKDWYDKLTLSKITGSKTFQALSIIITIIIGGYFIYKNGYQMKLLANDNYTYAYNTKDKEYYVYPKEKETPLNIYAPNEVKEIYIKYYENDTLVNEQSINDLNNILVEVNPSNINSYYKLSYEKEENDINTIKVYVLGSVTNE